MSRLLPLLWPLVALVVLPCSPSVAQFEGFVLPGNSSSTLKPPPNIPPPQIARWMLEHSRARQPKPAPHKETTDYSGLMSAMERRADYDEMISTARKQMTSHPREGRWYLYTGQAYFWKGDLQAAIAHWNKATILSPSLTSQTAPLRAKALRIKRANPNLSLRPIVRVSSEAASHRTALYQRVLPLQKARRWKDLDAVCDQMSGVNFDGTPDNDQAVEVLSNPQDNTEAGWNAKRGLLESWVKARPQSRWAKIVLYRAWIRHAWHRRGADYAPKVTQKQWSGAQSALTQATKIASSLPNSVQTNPTFYRVTLSFMVLAGTPIEQIKAVYAQAQRRFPTNRSLDFEMAWLLLPRWYGEPGEFQNFISTRADQIGGEAGDIAYGQMVLSQSDHFPEQKFWQQSHLSWPRAKRGFLALLRRNPNSVSIATWLMLNAQRNHDRSTARAMMIRLNNRANSSKWNNPHDFAVLRAQLLDPDSK